MEREGVAGGREEERERQGREGQGMGGRQGESVRERVRVNVSPMTSTTEGLRDNNIYYMSSKI